MNRLGPKIDGTSFVGETRSLMRWRWRSRSMGGGSCPIRDLSVAVTANCGTPPTGRQADSVAVTMSVTSRLEQGESLSTTTVTNTVTASVRQPEGPPVACRARGVLEQRLFETLLNQVTR